MSTSALRRVAVLTGLSPNEKLVLYQLADALNDSTGQCNPSIPRIAHLTGMTSPQVGTIIRSLRERGLIRASGRDFKFSFLGEATSPQRLPANWRPSQAAVQQLIDAYPRHHFDIEDAINAFRSYATRQKLTFDPSRLDAAFVRNISALLDRRDEGQVTLSSDRDRAENASVLSLLAGRR